MDDNEIGKILVSENDDGKAVWEFEGLVTSDVELDTESQDFAGAINELAKKLQQGGGGDEWQLPESFQNMPEAAEHQIIILYEVTEKTINRPVMSICPMPYTYDGSEYIDWGDGTITGILQGYSYNYSHFYTEPGLYVIKINCSVLTEYIYLNAIVGTAFASGGPIPPPGAQISGNNTLSYRENIRAIKFGENIYSETIIDSSNSFTGLVYVKYCGNSYNISAEKLDENHLNRLWHYGCSALCRVDFDVFPEKIPRNMFYGCAALRNASFTKNLTEIPLGAFQNCTALASADISSAETVGSSAFQNCTSLCSLKYSEDCVFGTNCFQNCYSLYPYPDRATN